VPSARGFKAPPIGCKGIQFARFSCTHLLGKDPTPEPPFFYKKPRAARRAPPEDFQAVLGNFIQLSQVFTPLNFVPLHG